MSLSDEKGGARGPSGVMVKMGNDRRKDEVTKHGEFESLMPMAGDWSS